MQTPTDRWNGVTAERVRAALDRVLASPPFQQSEASTRLLRHLVQHELDHLGERLREYTLAVEVFGISEDFDPRADSRVREEAGHLRSRLAEYYAGPGKREQVRIELPKGTFTPTFRTVRTKATVPRRPIRVRLLVRRAAWSVAAIYVCGIAALAGIRALQMESPTPSVAVLPFANLSSDHSSDYWSDGTTEEITDLLARVPGLRVVARSSAFRFKGTKAEVHAAGRELNVGAVVEGSVRRSGGRLRISAQLYNTEDGYMLWSASYDREEREIPGIEADLVEGIARNLELSVSDAASPCAPKLGVMSAAAHDLVLQARYQRADSPESDTRMRCYRRAIDADPGYEPAYAGMADEWVKRSLDGWIAPRAAMENARDAAAKALQLDNTDSNAHLLSAMVKWTYEWDWPGARREFERTLQLNPNHATARMQYARYLALMGRRKEAMKQLDEIRVLDPISPAAIEAQAAVDYLVRDYDGAIQHSQEALAAKPELGPMYYWMGRAYDSKGQPSEACAALEKWRSMSGGAQTAGFGMLGSVYYRAGRSYDALRLLGEAITRANEAHVSPSSMALLYSGLGERKRALEWLEKAYEQRDHSLVGIKADPAYDSLRNEAGFQSLLAKMKLN